MTGSFVLISMVVFLTVQLPPGDYATTLVALGATGEVNTRAAEEMAANIKIRFGLDKPVWQQYVIWVTNFMRGDMGDSLATRYVGERFGLSLVTLMFTWAIGIPIGIYTATHKNTLERSRRHAARIRRPLHPQLLSGPLVQKALAEPMVDQPPQRSHRVQSVRQRSRLIPAGHAIGRDDYLDRA